MGAEKFSVSGTFVDIINREIFGCEIEIEQGVIKEIKRRDTADGPFIMPGFIDSHVHIESSMLIPSQFAKMALKQGTIAVVTDPHEVANVAGIEGVRFMMNNALKVPLKFYFGVPSCVPASPLEKSGAELKAKDVEKLILENGFHFLAEMMNFPGVVNGDSEVLAKLRAAKQAGKRVDGHAPGLSGVSLKKYAQAGITTDHECSTVEEAIEKINLGMKILIREGSAAKNLVNLLPIIQNHPEYVMFCTDDCHPDYLKDGHINKIVARAIEMGYDLFDVLKAACINPIEHYQLPLGQLREGHLADFVLLDNLKDFNVIATYINGDEVYSRGVVNFEVKKEKLPQFPFRTRHTKNKLKVLSKGKRINVIGAVDGELLTDWIKLTCVVNIGEEVKVNIKEDLLKIVLLDRYSDSDPIVAFIKGFGLKRGAIAASVAHDSHHIISIGCDDHSIDSALEWVVLNKGGMCYANQENLEAIPLPFFGLMTSEEGASVSEKYERLNNLVKQNGSTLGSPFMTASFMALTVIPKLKIFHNGLFDGIDFKRVDLFEP